MWYNRWVAIKTLVRYKEQWFNKTGDGYVRSRMDGWGYEKGINRYS